MRESSLAGLDRVPDTAIVHEIDSLNADLGFSHLIDELSNAINPESGLPRELQFPADRLGKVSVPQAVERVAQINEWRAAQKAIADQAKANNAATVLHKEYPHSEAAPNPKGLRWVELKKSEALPDGWSTYDDPITGQTLPVTPEGRTITGDKADPRYAALQDALKYEGDTMGHCVGGYCEDVASGRSRIYSLRDAKGTPHVTVETGKAGGDLTPLEEYIVQIKGKGNLKPADEYQPFVQDFVKSGKWSDVGDLQNTGMERVGDYKQSVQDALKAAGIEHTYLTPEEIQPYVNAEFPGEPFPGKGYAQGGSIEQNNATRGNVCPNKIETVNDLRAIIRDIQSRL